MARQHAEMVRENMGECYKSMWSENVLVAVGMPKLTLSVDVFGNFGLSNGPLTVSALRTSDNWHSVQGDF